MVVFQRFRKLTAVAIGTGAGLAAYYISRLGEKESYVNTSWTNTDQPVSPCAVWNNNWDHREPQSLVRPVKNDSVLEENRFNYEVESVIPKATRHIILIRHGEYQEDGDEDETHRLTDRGRLQAKFTGKRLRDLGIKWDKVIASTMTRAQETAHIILEALDYDKSILKSCDFIREGAPIPPQPPSGHWRPMQAFFRDGSRIEAGFRRYFYRAYPDQKTDSHTLIIGHANVIRYYVCRALQLPPEAWLRISINHASVTWITISPSGNVSIKSLGDCGFLPPKYLTNRMPRKS